MSSRFGVLGSPAFVGAVAVLAFNDHVLKGWGPGWLTGRLSDFAGVFVVGVLMGVATRRPRVGAVVVAVAFAALKLWRGAAVLAAPVLGGVTRQDPWDLVALVALVPACRLAARRVDAAAAWRRVAIGASAAATVLTVTATSCVPEPHIDALVVDGAVVYARIFDSDDLEIPAYRWARSDDGGLRWRATDAPSGERLQAVGQGCLADGTCFAAVRDSQVVEQRGGVTRTSFMFSDDEREVMRLRESCPSAGDPFGALVIARAGGGEHVVVAMASQGVLRRSPDGRWRRVAVLDLKPLSTSGPRWASSLVLTPLLLVLLPLIAVALRRRRARVLGAPVMAFAAAFAFALTGAGAVAMLMEVDFVVAGIGTAVVALVVFVAAVWQLYRGQPGGRGEESRGSEPLTSETAEERQ